MKKNKLTGSSRLQYLVVTALFFFIMSIAGCSGSCEFTSEKMDTPLKMKINDLKKTDPGALIKFIGKCSREIDTEMDTQLKATGVNIESKIKEIFTASGTVAGIKKISALDFVVSLELAKRMDIK